MPRVSFLASNCQFRRPWVSPSSYVASATYDHADVSCFKEPQMIAGTGCPERLLMPHPWKHSRSSWTGLWATWSSWRCPCLLQGGWTRWPLKVTSNPNHSVILSSVFMWLNQALRALLSSAFHRHLHFSAKVLWFCSCSLQPFSQPSSCHSNLCNHLQGGIAVLHAHTYPP